jgi:hypothetical protein
MECPGTSAWLRYCRFGAGCALDAVGGLAGAFVVIFLAGAGFLRMREDGGAFFVAISRWYGWPVTPTASPARTQLNRCADLAAQR